MFPPGARLGPYEIVGPVGAGGMGEVYRARDIRLERTVAVKVLPAEFAKDAKLKIRLEREAKALAAMNHPHICSLFDVGDSYLVMEYCEGTSLSDRIRRGRLPAADVLHYGIQIADALDKAHRKGIIHRDLKPSNIMVTTSGVKVLDFGLVRRQSDWSPDQSTMERLTDDGSIPGTVQYMAPEVLQGEPADPRSDIFALGVVLYEMLTGQPAFNGKNKASLVAAILEREPVEICSLMPNVPAALDRLIRNCLIKDPDERIQTAHDVMLQLRTIGEMSPKVQTRSLSQFAPVALALIVLLLATLLYWSRKGSSTGAPGSPLAAFRATFLRLTDLEAVESGPSLSPDGKFVVYCSNESGNKDIYLLRVGGKTAMSLTAASAAHDREPAWSPDGQQIAFRSERDGGGIYIMGATGESPRRVAGLGFNPAWSPDGREVVVSSVDVEFSPFQRWPLSGALTAIDVTNGRTRPITNSANLDAVQPSWSPHGHRIAFVSTRFAGCDGQFDVLTVPSGGGMPVPVTRDSAIEFSPVWSPDGNYLYFSSTRGGTPNIWRVAIDETTGQTKGLPETLTAPSPWAAITGFSSDGLKAVFLGVDIRQNIERTSLDPRTPKVTVPPRAITATTKAFGWTDVSKDGQWLVTVHHPEWYLSILRNDGKGLRKLTDGPGDRHPVWSPDGQWVAFNTARNCTEQSVVIRSDGSGLRQIVDTGAAVRRPIFSPDGTRVAVSAPDVCPSGTCLVPLMGSLPTKEVEDLTPYGEGWLFRAMAWSPDAEWLVGNIRPGGTAEAFGLSLQPDEKLAVYSLKKRQYEVIASFAASPQWMSDSRRMLYVRGTKLFVIDRTSRQTKEIFDIGRPVTQRVSLSSDDRDIYWSRVEGESDLWLMELKP